MAAPQSLTQTDNGLGPNCSITRMDSVEDEVGTTMPTLGIHELRPSPRLRLDEVDVYAGATTSAREGWHSVKRCICSMTSAGLFRCWTALTGCHVLVYYMSGEKGGRTSVELVWV